MLEQFKIVNFSVHIIKGNLKFKIKFIKINIIFINNQRNNQICL